MLVMGYCGRFMMKIILSDNLFLASVKYPIITLTTKSPDLSIPFADVLNVDTIQSLKDGLGMMGMRFTGNPTKAQIVKTFDEYVKENPADVLRCRRSEELTLKDNILKQGRGGHITVKGIGLLT